MVRLQFHCQKWFVSWDDAVTIEAIQRELLGRFMVHLYIIKGCSKYDIDRTPIIY